LLSSFFNPEDRGGIFLRDVDDRASKLCFYLPHAGFLLGLFFHPEDGGNMSLRNVDDKQSKKTLFATCIMLVSYLAFSSEQKMETCSSETSMTSRASKLFPI
jgi:hypothetical protein